MALDVIQTRAYSIAAKLELVAGHVRRGSEHGDRADRFGRQATALRELYGELEGLALAAAELDANEPREVEEAG